MLNWLDQIVRVLSDASSEIFFKLHVVNCESIRTWHPLKAKNPSVKRQKLLYISQDIVRNCGEETRFFRLAKTSIPGPGGQGNYDTSIGKELKEWHKNLP